MTEVSPPPPAPSEHSASPKAGAPVTAVPRLWARWPIALAAALVILAVALILTVPSYFIARTNDAYVEADVVTVAPQVAGTVTQLDVSDNSRFEAGEVLLRIDDREYRNAVDSAASALSSAKAARDAAAALLAHQADVVRAARALLSGDRAQVRLADEQIVRYRHLAPLGFGSVEHLQGLQAEYRRSESTLERDSADYRGSLSEVGVLRARLEQAIASVGERTAALDEARLKLSYTRITADFDGTVANRIVRRGLYVEPGQALLSEVPNQFYVIANYEETQLAHMRVGQRVSIHVDAFPRRSYRGHIQSIQRGTGSVFALLPPENATGNFVKVTQRVPIKIVFDEPVSRLVGLAAGMSVETDVSLHSLPGALSWFP